MNLGDDYSQLPKPKEKLERVFLAISAAVCIFAFQNCSSPKNLGANNKASSSQTQYQVDQSKASR